jgi:hypothetical protein
LIALFIPSFDPVFYGGSGSFDNGGEFRDFLSFVEEKYSK